MLTASSQINLSNRVFQLRVPRNSKANAPIIHIEHRVVVVEEGDAHDPEARGGGEVQVHDLEHALAALLHDVVLSGEDVHCVFDLDLDVWIGLVLFFTASTSIEIIKPYLPLTPIFLTKPLCKFPEVLRRQQQKRCP